jgi:putative ATP-binding cassette transporter
VKKKAWFLLILSLALISLGIWVDVERTKINGQWINNLQLKKQEEYFHSLYLMFGILLVWLTIIAASFFVKQYIGLFWREWMTVNYLEKYLLNESFYKLQQERKIDNPDQRIADDIRSFVEKTVKLFTRCL